MSSITRGLALHLRAVGGCLGGHVVAPRGLGRDASRAERGARPRRSRRSPHPAGACSRCGARPITSCRDRRSSAFSATGTLAEAPGAAPSSAGCVHFPSRATRVAPRNHFVDPRSLHLCELSDSTPPPADRAGQPLARVTAASRSWRDQGVAAERRFPAAVPECVPHERGLPTSTTANPTPSNQAIHWAMASGEPESPLESGMRTRTWASLTALRGSPRWRRLPIRRTRSSESTDESGRREPVTPMIRDFLVQLEELLDRDRAAGARPGPVTITTADAVALVRLPHVARSPTATWRLEVARPRSSWSPTAASHVHLRGERVRVQFVEMLLRRSGRASRCTAARCGRTMRSYLDGQAVAVPSHAHAGAEPAPRTERTSGSAT